MRERLAALQELLEIVDRLRGPGGCPWDQKQTLHDMGRHLLEESCEVVDAVDESAGKPSAHVCEELGDALMNVLLAARIAEDTDAFSITHVAQTISSKLVRRHPHVFSDVVVSGVDDVLHNWNKIKELEAANSDHHSGEVVNRRRKSHLDQVPKSLPPLSRAFQFGKKAAELGFDWPTPDGAFEKVEEELDEVRELLYPTGRSDSHESNPADTKLDRDALTQELGDLLFAVANLCRKAKIRPDDALRSTLRKFATRFRAIEERFPEPQKESLATLEEVWQAAKGDAATGEADNPGSIRSEP